MNKKFSILIFFISIFILLFLFLDKNKTYGFLVKEKIQTESLEIKNPFTFIYFGYLKCKSFCPTSLGILKQISDSVKNKNIEFIFVSIDEKDSIENLLEYKKNFDPRFKFYPKNNEQAKRFMQVFKVQASENLIQNNSIHHMSNLFLIHENSYIIYPSNFTDVKKILEDMNYLEK